MTDKRIRELAMRHAREWAVLHVQLAREAIGINTGTKCTTSTKRRRDTRDPRSNAGIVRDYLSAQPWATYREIRIATSLSHETLGKVLSNPRQFQKRGKRRAYQYALALRLAGKAA